MNKVIVTGSFDNLKSYDFRFLQEAANYGSLIVLLWSDDVVLEQFGKVPQFPQAERTYFLNAIRYVDQVILVDQLENPDEIPAIHAIQPEIWVVFETEDTLHKRVWTSDNGVNYQVLRLADLWGFPDHLISETDSSNPKVIVTGCFDWFHSGHVRFFEETSQLGDLYVVVGHDENVRLLKGEGHPLFGEEERRYMVGSIRFVKQALISSGRGWMDAEPEIEVIQPDIYAVNEDGDNPEKRAFCEQQGLVYVVLKRTPAAGLPRRESTHLRGF